MNARLSISRFLSNTGMLVQLCWKYWSIICRSLRLLEQFYTCVWRIFAWLTVLRFNVSAGITILRNFQTIRQRLHTILQSLYWIKYNLKEKTRMQRTRINILQFNIILIKIILGVCRLSYIVAKNNIVRGNEILT